MSELLHELNAIALLVLGCVALGLASGRWYFVAIPGLAALVRPLVGRRLVIAPRPIVYLGVILGCLLLARVRPVVGRGSGINFAVSFYVALGLLVCAVGRLYSRPDPQQRPHVLLAGALAIAAAGTDIAADAYSIVVGLSCLPILLLLRGSLAATGHLVGSRRATKLACVGFPVLLVVGGTYALAETWRRNYSALDTAILSQWRDLAPSQQGGFSGTAGLGSIGRLKGDQGHEIALRAFGAREPGYLRAKVFAEYEAGEWHAPPKGEEVTPDRQEETETTGRVTLPGHPAAAAGRSADFAIFPVARYAGHYFLPSATQTFATASPSVTVFPGGACESPSDSSGYEVFLDAHPSAQGASDPSYTRVPLNKGLGPALDGVIAKLERRDSSAAESVRALARYFARNYRYEIGIKIEPDEEPVVAFLTHIDHGHCEFFASAGVLLLRRMGFAARYVTGFVCNEKSVVGDVWIARQEHAHAWVEVYDPATASWTTAEFTPESGQPHPAPESGLSARWEWIVSQAKRAGAILWRIGPLGAIRVVGAWLLGRWYRAGTLVLLVVFVTWRRRRPARARRSAHVSPLPPGLASERERLVVLERRLARDGLGRSPGETLLEYAQRVGASEHALRDEAVAFLRDYSARRYEPFSV